jgi:hypothetical protein
VGLLTAMFFGMRKGMQVDDPLAAPCSN